MRFCKIKSVIILHNSSSSPWPRLRTSFAAFCTAAAVPDLSYSAAANSKILDGFCVPCCDKKKEYSRIRMVAGKHLLITLCMTMKSLTNAKLESLCQDARCPHCLKYIFNIIHENCKQSKNILKVPVQGQAYVSLKCWHCAKHSANKSMWII